MTASSIPHERNAPQPEPASPPIAYLARCCFCEAPPRPGSLYCDACAAIWWRELQAVNPELPDFTTLRPLVLAARKREDERRKAAADRDLLAITTTNPTLPLAILQDRRLHKSAMAPRVYGLLVARGAARRFVPIQGRLMANELSVSMSAVYRTIDKLIALGYLEHRSRRGVKIRASKEERGK